MIRDVISTENAPGAIGPYSQGIAAEGRFYFFSGQIPLQSNGGLITGDITAQTRQVLTNIQALLESQGLNFAHVVKTTVFLSSMELFGEFNKAYADFFPEAPPARSTVAVAGLPMNVDVEIEVIAVA
jgi:2-iminobutanoate/2-iminopropanoate deaminase